MSKFLFNPLSGTFDLVYNKAEEIEFVPDTPELWTGTIANTGEALNTIKSDIADGQFLVKEPTGFVDRTSTALEFDDVSREFLISPVGASFDVYIKGNKYTKTEESIIISDDPGNHYIYYDDSGALSETAIFDPSLFENNAFVSIIYWNTNTSTHSYFADERHGLVMDGATHGYLHTVFGARYINGLALQNFEPDGTGDSGIEAQFEGDSGSIRDEDILISLGANAYMPVLFREGLQWRKKIADAFPVIYNGTAGYTGTRLAYNQFTGGAWQLTEVTENDFVLCHVFATNDYENPYVAILGVNQYANIPAARAAAETEISSLSGLPFAEFVAVGTVIFQTSSAYTNDPKARVRSAAAGEIYVDFRGEQLYTPSGVATSHSLLSNLSSDDHPQYAKVVSPALTGTPTVPTQTEGDNSTSIASTAYADNAAMRVREYNPYYSGDWIAPAPTEIHDALDSLALNKAGPVTDTGTVAGGQSLVNLTSPTDVRIKGLKAGAGISITDDAGFQNLVIENTAAAGDYVLKTGDVMSGTLSVSVPAAGTSNLGWQGLSAQSADFNQSADCTIDSMSIYLTNPGVSVTSTVILPDQLSIVNQDIVFGNTFSANIQSGRMTLASSNGVTISPTIPSLPEEVTTKAYVDTAIAAAAGNTVFTDAINETTFVASTSGDTFALFTGEPRVKLANTTVAGSAKRVAFSPDGKFLVAIYATTPFISVFSVDHATGTLTALANPTNLPATAPIGAEWTWDGKCIIVQLSAAPWLWMYKINYDDMTFSKVAQATTMAGMSMPNHIAFTNDNLRLVVGYSGATAPYGSVVMFDLDTELGGIDYRNNVTTVTNQVVALAINPSDNTLTYANSSPAVGDYRFFNYDMTTGTYAFQFYESMSFNPTKMVWDRLGEKLAIGLVNANGISVIYNLNMTTFTFDTLGFLGTLSTATKNSIAWHPSGDYFVASCGGVSASQTMLCRVRIDLGVVVSIGNIIPAVSSTDSQGVAISPNGRLMALCQFSLAAVQLYKGFKVPRIYALLEGG